MSLAGEEGTKAPMVWRGGRVGSTLALATALRRPRSWQRCPQGQEHKQRSSDSRWQAGRGTTQPSTSGQPVHSAAYEQSTAEPHPEHRQFLLEESHSGSDSSAQTHRLGWHTAAASPRGCAGRSLRPHTHLGCVVYTTYTINGDTHKGGLSLGR